MHMHRAGLAGGCRRPLLRWFTDYHSQGETITMSTITRVNNNDITGTSAVGGAILDLGFLFTQTVETDYYLFSFFFFWGLCTTILFFSSDQMSNSLSSEEQKVFSKCNATSEDLRKQF